MKLNDALVVYTHPAADEYKRTLNLVKKILKKYKIKYHLADRDRLKFEQFHTKDLIIAVGGDGTFLRAAQFVKNEILLGVNADVKSKEGFFMEGNKKNFEKKMKKIINDEFEIKKYPRLEAYINRKRIDALALNEFYIGAKKGYHAAKYTIKINDYEERHKSSGILVATPAGSYAWASACVNRKLSLKSKTMLFVVREPYQGKIFKNYRLKHGLLGKKDGIKIKSEMLDGVIVADSVSREYPFKNGSSVTVKLSDKYLRVICPK